MSVSPINKPLVIIPTYDEAENIAEVLERVCRAAPTARVLVVDDNSPDGTADVVRRCQAGNDRIELMTRAGKEGLGAAYKAGFAWGLARDHDAFVQMDADLSHDPGAVPELVGRLADGTDVAIGSRYVAGGSIPAWGWHRRLLSRWGNRYASRVLGLPLRDVTSGFRAYRRGAVAGLDLDSIAAEGYGFLIELIYRISTEQDALITEIPIAFHDRQRGKSKMSGRIIAEALMLVTWWGLRDRVRRSGIRRAGAGVGG